MDEKSVCIKVAVSADEYCKFQKENFKYFRIILSIILPIIVSIYVAVGTDVTNTISISISVILFFVMLIASYFYLPWESKKIWMRQYNANKLMQSEQTYIITADGLKRFSETETSQYKWSDLHAHRETTDSFWIYTSNNQCYYIPKSKIGNDDSQIDLVRSYLKKLPDYKEKITVLDNIKVSAFSYIALFFIILVLIITLKIFK